MTTTNPVNLTAINHQQMSTSVATGNSSNSAEIVPPLVQPSQVVPPKKVEIALDTSGVSAASVRESARPIEKAAQEAASSIQQFIQSKGVLLNISVDHSTGFNIIQVIDPNTGETVMQLPAEEAVRIAHVMDSLQGLLVSKFA